MYVLLMYHHVCMVYVYSFMVWLGVYLLMSWIQNHFYFFYLLYISLIDVVVFKNTYELDVFYSFTSAYSISYTLKYNT